MISKNFIPPKKQKPVSRNKNIILVVSIFVLVAAVLALVTEFRDVTAYPWKEKYDYEDQDPLGLYVFSELTQRYFADLPVVIDAELNDSLKSKSLIIQFVPQYLHQEVSDTLQELARVGNDVLIIADYYDTVNLDTIDVELGFYYEVDSMITFNFTDSTLAADTDYVHTFQNQEFNETVEDEYYLLQVAEDHNAVRVSAQDSLAMMLSFPMGQGNIFIHTNRQLFYNYAFRQPRHFDYMQGVLSYFDPEQIYLINPLSSNDTFDLENQNPLEYIMSNPSLRAAYYCLLIGALLFVIFRGKRKQRIIPVIKPNKNTSLEYIETVSHLFYQQNQHEKLVEHMKTIFYHKMQKRYFISPDHPDYVNVLAKKSKISSRELQYVMDRFQNLEDNFGFKENQLSSLHQRLESIYDQIEKS